MSSPVKRVKKLEVSSKPKSGLRPQSGLKHNSGLKPNSGLKTNSGPKPNSGLKNNFFFQENWRSAEVRSRDLLVLNCPVCRNHTRDLCTECKDSESPTSEKCDIAWGVCKHAYHFHCITDWLTQHEICPLCFEKWELLKRGN